MHGERYADEMAWKYKVRAVCVAYFIPSKFRSPMLINECVCV